MYCNFELNKDWQLFKWRFLDSGERERERLVDSVILLNDSRSELNGDKVNIIVWPEHILLTPYVCLCDFVTSVLVSDCIQFNTWADAAELNWSGSLGNN